MDPEGDWGWLGPGSCDEWWKSSWRQVANAVTHWSVLWPAPITILINDLDGGAVHTLIKLVMIQSCEQWLMCQVLVPPPRGTWTFWGNGREEPLVFLWVEIKIPALGEKQPHAPVHAWKRLCREGPWDPDGHQADHESGTHSCSRRAKVT